jgi:hypothetical protein
MSVGGSGSAVLAQDNKFGPCRLDQATNRGVGAQRRSGRGAEGAHHREFPFAAGANTKPSQEDLERWREMLDRAFTRHEMRKQVHLIVSEGRDGEWFRPTLTAWVCARTSRWGVAHFRMRAG